MKKILILATTFLLSSMAQAGGGWTHPKGEGYLKMGYNRVKSDRFFAPDASIIDITTVGYHATSLYGEYGLSDRFTAIAYVPFFTRSTLNAVRFRQSGREIPGDSFNSIGDIDLSLQYGFLKSEKWVASARILLGLPTGNPQGGDSGILQSGDGEFNQMLRLDLSRSFARNYWAGIYAGFNNRTNNFSDEVRVGGELGKAWEGGFMAIVKLDVVQSLFNGTADASMGGTLFSNNTEFISPALELAYRFDNGIGVSASAAGAFFGRNILASPNLGVGIFWSF
jgi:protein XagA